MSCHKYASEARPKKLGRRELPPAPTTLRHNLEMALSIAVVALGYAPTMRPVGQQRSAVQMQEAAGQPDAISTTGGYVEAPTALKDELGAIGPLGYWDPLGMVRSPACQSPCVLSRCVINAAALHALSRCSLAACAAGGALLPPPASAVWFHSRCA